MVCMLNREAGEIVFICDGCNDALETGERDFDDALAVFRDNPGWQVRRQGNDWQHYCPDCRLNRSNLTAFEPA